VAAGYLRSKREAPLTGSRRCHRPSLSAVVRGAHSTERPECRSIAVPPRRINEIVHGQRRISADTALRLARFFGTSERFWMNLQSRYDLEIEKDRLGPVLDEIHPLTAAGLDRLRLSA
jgi:addiction module HigA family antidote